MYLSANPFVLVKLPARYLMWIDNCLLTNVAEVKCGYLCPFRISRLCSWLSADYEISEDGSFSCRLSQLTYVTFGTGAEAKQVCYKERITGVLKDLQLTNLAGVTAKKVRSLRPLTTASPRA